MKLSTCPACEQSVSPQAAACPKCGQPLQRPKGRAGKVLKAGGLLAMIVGVVGSMGAAGFAGSMGAAAAFFLLGFVGFIAAIVGRFLD